jgi:hypothetical protein
MARQPRGAVKTKFEMKQDVDHEVYPPRPSATTTSRALPIPKHALHSNKYEINKCTSIITRRQQRESSPQARRLVTSLYARTRHFTGTYGTGNGREGKFAGGRQVCVEAGITRSEKGGFGDVGAR